jgi:hypothetical protein
VGTEDDKERAAEWTVPVPHTTVDEAPPELLEEDRTTSPHQVLGPAVDQAFESGRQVGYTKGLEDGRDDVFRALGEVFAETPGGVDDSARAVIARVFARVRTKLTPV